LKLSVVIPAYNESGSVESTVRSIDRVLSDEQIDHEILVVNDSSTDDTGEIISRVAAELPAVKRVDSPYEGGFGLAVRTGLEQFSGDCVAIMMADNSDSPIDLVSYYRLLEQGYDCAFGSRFISGAHVHDYPRFKLFMNRIANFVVNVMFRLGYNDTTNAFKAYRRDVIESVQPLMSKHFNLTVELPLKAVIRGSTFAVTPISWTNRTAGEAKLAIKEMGSRYVFIILYAFLERHLTRGDYLRSDARAKRSSGAGHNSTDT